MDEKIANFDFKSHVTAIRKQKDKYKNKTRLTLESSYLKIKEGSRINIALLYSCNREIN